VTPNGLNILISKLIDCGFVSSSGPITASHIGNGRLSVEVGDTSAPTRFNAGYENSYDHYVHMVEEGRYSFMVSDGALLSLKYELDGNEMAAHRFVYVPSVTELDVDNGDTVEMLPGPIEYFSTPRRALLRFEYDPPAFGDRHPYSHLHLNSAECRMPVSGALSVKSFLYLVVDAFYPQFLPELEQELAPTQPSVTHIGDLDRARPYLKIPL